MDCTYQNTHKKRCYIDKWFYNNLVRYNQSQITRVFQSCRLGNQGDLFYGPTQVYINKISLWIRTFLCWLLGTYVFQIYYSPKPTDRSHNYVINDSHTLSNCAVTIRALNMLLFATKHDQPLYLKLYSNHCFWHGCCDRWFVKLV